MAAVFRDFGLSYNVAFTRSEVGQCVEFPWIPPSTFLARMAQTGDMKHVLGGFKTVPEACGLLKEFWSRYEAVCPEHEAFARVRAGEVQTHQMIPLYLHGDEGVTYKKKGVLIVSFQSPFGQGSRHGPAKPMTTCNTPEQIAESGIPLNLLKTALKSRMISILAPKE